MPSEAFTHPETTASRRPACACGHPLPVMIATASPVTFRASCCFAEYVYYSPLPGSSEATLALVKEGPEPIGAGLCDACETPALFLYAFNSAPAAGLAICRACLETPRKRLDLSLLPPVSAVLTLPARPSPAKNRPASPLQAGGG